MAVFIPPDPVYGDAYGAVGREAVRKRTELVEVGLTASNWQTWPEVCARVEVIFGSWGMPVMGRDFLEAFPRLEAVFYAAGSVKGFVDPGVWERGIVVCSANGINAEPVADFTVAQILLAAKGAFVAQRRAREFRACDFHDREMVRGLDGRRIGLIALGAIGQLVAERLRAYPVCLTAFDPHCPAQRMNELGCTSASLDELFASCDIVSCHLPHLPETVRLLKAEHFRSLPAGSTFINTARGAVVDELALVAVLRERPDLTALLDVTDPEPPEADSLLFSLPNVFLTPHLAGCVGVECLRLGAAMIEEFDRWIAAEQLRYRVEPEFLSRMA